MPQFELLIEASSDPVLRLGIAHFLEQPELIDITVAGPLNYMRPIFEPLPKNV